MSKDMEKALEKIEMFPIGYVENDYLEPAYNEEVYQKNSKIILKKELVEGLYRIEDFRKVYILFYFSKAEVNELISNAVKTGSYRGFLPAEAHTAQIEPG